MSGPTIAPEVASLRPASQIMRLSVMGASFPTRLSFLRRLIRALRDEDAKVVRPVWNIDAKGFGHAVYSVGIGGFTYSLVAFTRDLPADDRTDRVIATAWDAAFVLYDGVPDAREIARLGANAPLQEVGRFTERDLVLSRANKSVRLFAEVIAALKAGAQPDPARIAEIGYLMRTTAVYGNGKFGSADRSIIADRPLLDGPFAAEMLTVWLIRGFTHDLIEHIGGGTLERRLKRHLGIGNATGLGMAPFLVSHPILMHKWVLARETALARCLEVAAVSAATAARIGELGERAARHLGQWHVPDAAYTKRIAALSGEWAAFRRYIEPVGEIAQPYLHMLRFAASDAGIAAELQELIAALILEANPEIVDPLAETMAAHSHQRLDGAMSCGALRAGIETRLGWALSPDFGRQQETWQFWYVSEEKLELRLGLRHAEPGAELESPLDIARRIQALYVALDGAEASVAEFLMDHPEHRFAARRAQTALLYPYAEIHDNLIGERCLPIDMLRFKLAMFGASKFDPKSDRWTRITLAQGAPLFDELTRSDADDWWLPVFVT